MKIAKDVGIWIKDHFVIVLVAAALMAVFFLVPQFKELSYGLGRAAIVLAAISGFIWLAFGQTIRPWLVGGGLIADFKAAEAKHRMAFFAGILLAVTIVVVECVVHP
jgi:hypothetical protein